jgi:hypothetical protein
MADATTPTPSSQSTDPKIIARNARLKQLQTSATAWATARTTELNNQVTVLKLILNSRKGAGQTAQSGVSATSALVVSSIDDFLTG